MDYAIETEDLCKAYRLFPSPLKRVAEVTSLGRYKGHHEFWALRGVSLRIEPGTSVGLCGANGAGKSTLLKILSRTTAPTRGRFRIRGRVASLLELGAGFHMDFTGRANIVMNGVMMGFTRREMEAKMEQIVEFAELGSFIDEPVRTYSSGMGLRLGFAVAVSVDPDVLIIDEVFAVGDMYFQKKCIDKIYDFKHRGKTILFCSHSLYDIRQLCDQALWLKNGEPAAFGSSVSVTNEYQTFQTYHIDQEYKQGAFRVDEQPVAPEHEKDAAPAELPHILEARIFRAGTDEEVYEVTTGDDLEFRIWWENPRHAHEDIQLGVGFFRQDMSTMAGCATHLSGHAVSGPAGCTVLSCPRFSFLSGQYLIGVVLFDAEGVHKYQQYMIADNLVVHTATRDVGWVRLEHDWHERPDLAPTPDLARSRGAAGDGA